MKDEFLNVRIAQTLKKKFEQILEEKKTSKSDGIRSAINNYIYVNGKTKPAMIFSFNELDFLLDTLNDSQIMALAKITAKNRLEMHNYWYRSYYDIKDPMKEIAPKTVINDFLYNLAIKFLEQINIKSSWDKDKRFFVKISHKFNVNFSKYLKYFLQNYLGVFSLDLNEKEATLNEKEVILQFNKK